MNLSEALDAALPEIPRTRLARSRPPQLDPDLIVREDVLDGEPFVGVLQRGKGNFFRFPPSQWQLALLFDGVRSYQEIADLYTETTGASLDATDVRLFAENMEESDFWFKTAQEKNLALSEKLVARRSRRANQKSKINVAHISFSAWDPDNYLGWLDRAIGDFLYSRWCVLAVLLLFVFEATVFIAKWSVIGPDAVLYYNFADKSLLDFVQFWLLILVLGFFHESAHGLTCKHFNGEVHSMGLMFLYLTPCFYADVTETWISATKAQRLATIIAGIWIEMIFCGFAMIVWVNTQPGQWVHDFAYQIILITGLAVVVINMNPLIKLDGYYFLTESIGIPDLKERSTAFLSGWFQSHALGLTVETPVVPRRRVPLFVIYAFVSGMYSYLLLFFAIRFSYNIASKWMAEFALIPAGAFAFAVFRSRLRSLRDLVTRLWTQRFGTGFRWRPVQLLAIIALMIILFVPIWRDREDALYVIEPLHSSTLHASVPGWVAAVLVREGEHVHAGQPLLLMNSPASAAMQSSAAAQTAAARFQAFTKEIRGSSIGTSAAQANAALRASELAGQAQSALVVVAPTNGIVLTPDPKALLDRNVASGESLLDIAGTEPNVVRLFVPAIALNRIRPNDEVALSVPGRFSQVRLRLAPLSGEAVHLPAGLVARQNYKGIALPIFYDARMPLSASESDLPLGMSGEAKIFGSRRSIAERIVAVILDLVRAHVW